jgi:energy-coupling factor transporter ATP-binding protein EcfA2/rubrerythrin
VDFGDGESIVVYGDNGTGKSTIADALEWYFTGEIELLSHEGRQHAVRHVGGDDQDVTSVEVFTTGALGGKAVIPDERPPEAFQAMRRETFLLRGRSLADFINKTKTEKWKALVEILGLDAIEDLREDLQRARNDLRKESKAAEEQVRQYARALSSGNEAATPEGVLASVQQFCEMLGVDPPGSLDQAVDPAWLRAAVGATERDEPESQEHLLDDIRSLATPAIDAKLLKGWNALVSSERARLFPRASLVREARRLVETHPAGGRCPVCGQSITDKELAKKIERALADVMDASRELERLRDPIAEWAEDLDAAIDTRTALHERARAAAFTLPPVPSLPSTGLQSCLDSLAAIDIEAVTACVTGLKNWDKAAGKLVKEPGAAEASTRDTQLLMLAGLCDQIRGWQQARQKSARALRALTLAERVFDAYQAKQKADLSAILEKISHRVAEIYAALHPGEDFAEAVTIEPWTAKGVELAVEFYGSRQRPPHGVLSESHLNSLAIAVFLAMAETFNKQLGFLLLDDVINSFDVEHRGQLAQLLAEGFSTWQLIVLTHDQQFFEHLSRRAPSWRKVELTSWSYGSGPRTTQYKTSGILAAARERLGSGDVHGAATKARRALEEQLQEVCEALWAPLPFRRGQANDKREIGELFKGVRRALKDRAKTMLDSVEPLLKNLEADVGATLNVEVHGSRGRSGASEVEAALNRIQALDGIWSCPECGTRVWHRGNPEAGRCRCGQRAFPPVGVNPL